MISSPAVHAEETDWDAVDQQMADLPDEPSEDPTQFNIEDLVPELEPDTSEISAPLEEDELSKMFATEGLSDSIFANLPKPKTSYEAQACFRMTIHVFKKPRGLNIPWEFGFVEVDGKFKNLFVVSTSKPGLRFGTIEGDFTPQPVRIYTKARPKVGLPFAFPVSKKYNSSPMYWGLQISGNYLIHATPHYGQLGRPASMGCVRVNYPTAMELWDQVVNRVRGSATINIYGSGSSDALVAYKKLKSTMGFTDEKIRSLIKEDLDDAHAASTGEYHGNGHWRRVPGRVYPHIQKGTYPLCMGKSCFKMWSKTPRVSR